MQQKAAVFFHFIWKLQIYMKVKKKKMLIANG
jgi:hypothetical protein